MIACTLRIAIALFGLTLGFLTVSGMVFQGDCERCARGGLYVWAMP